MKHIASGLTTGLIILFLCSSCYYYKDDTLNPPEGFSCDTTNVTFNGKILNMIAANCLVCHSNVAAIDGGSGIYLDTYNDVRARAMAISGAINHTGGYFPMPKNAPRLDPCLRLQFETWINNGLPEN
jgi:uncharacterized membrane protein